MRMSISVSVNGRWGREDGKRMASRLVQNAIPTALVSQRHVKQSEMERQGTWLGEILKRLRIEAHVRPTLLRPAQVSQLQLVARAHAMMRWAPSTVSTKASIWGQFNEFALANNMLVSEDAMILFLEAKLAGGQIDENTFAKYARELLQIANMPKTLSLRDVAAARCPSGQRRVCRQGGRSRLRQTMRRLVGASVVQPLHSLRTKSQASAEVYLAPEAAHG